MKKISSILVLFILIFKTSFANETYSSDPKMFVEELVNDAISKLSDKNLREEEKVLFIEKIALKNVDIAALGLYTLGDLRKTTEKDNVGCVQIAGIKL